ncbi:hypothetical protein ROHU_025972 [Labeo rohita]|uniref:Uncharacterized protein n=1 Tax=Labeo rohita TaxID=84645 RepID=A0A498LI67_LABRO|nr:hypothetical protein ROHU_032090 [Labeo rohita]RXN18832.1 hypothetical protein ROHU_025972 [Labeo rohita]
MWDDVAVFNGFCGPESPQIHLSVFHCSLGSQTLQADGVQLYEPTAAQRINPMMPRCLRSRRSSAGFVTSDIRDQSVLMETQNMLIESIIMTYCQSAGRSPKSPVVKRPNPSRVSLDAERLIFLLILHHKSFLRAHFRSSKRS